MNKISIDLFDLMEIVSEFILDQQEANPMGMAPYCEYAFNKYQPERSKREDTAVYTGTLPDYLNWCEPTTMWCGALDSMET